MMKVDDYYIGVGSPEGKLTAPVGAVYFALDSGSVYVRESGRDYGTTGWVSLPGGGGGGGATLEVDGVQGSQTLLNLVSGTNIHLSDDGNGNVTLNVRSTTPATVASGSTPAFNFTNTRVLKHTMTSNITPTMSGANDGDSVTLKLVQDGTGNRTVTWPANAAGTPPQPSGTAASVTIYKFTYDATAAKFYLDGAPVGGQ